MGVFSNEACFIAAAWVVMSPVEKVQAGVSAATFAGVICAAGENF
jgi:hypothetical protein